MTDAVMGGLRKWAGERREYGEISDVCKAAMDEIAHLREELDTWRSVFPDIAPASVQPDRSLVEAELATMRASNERLSDALRPFAQYGGPGAFPGLADTCDVSIVVEPHIVWLEKAVAVGDFRKANAAIAEVKP